MDAKQINRLIIAVFAVPFLLFVLNIVIARSIVYGLFLLESHASPFGTYRLVFWARNTILAGAGFWLLLYAYVYVRYGDFRISRLKPGKKDGGAQDQ